MSGTAGPAAGSGRPVLPGWVRDVQHVRLGGVDIAYVRRGSGPPALLIHGALLNSAQYVSIIDELPEFCCVAVDLMGHGRTRIDDDQPLGMDAQAEVLARFIEALDLGPVNLVGSDSGGGVAQVLAVTRPELVASLTLTNCDIHSNNPPRAFAGFMRELKRSGTLEFFRARVADPQLAREPLSLGSAVEEPARLTDEMVVHFFEPFCASRQQAENLFRYLVQNDGRHTIALEHELHRLTAPLTLIWGTGDQYFSLDWAFWLLARVPFPRLLHVIPGAKLYMHFDRPELIAQLFRLAWSSPGGRR
jgi:pimeloyl-ACP methyl ester carboxylesterase